VTIYFVDLEASSLGSGSFPIEVASVNENGQGESHLIRPEPAWTNWSPQSEQVHGISQSLLLQQGKSADWVARRALTTLSGAILVSDDPAFDAHWLSMLFKVIWNKTEIEMVDLRSLVGQAIQRLFVLIEARADSPEWRRQAGLLLHEGQVLAANIIETETRRPRIKHRALLDAEYLWRCWNAVQRAVDQRVLKRSLTPFENKPLHSSAGSDSGLIPDDRDKPIERPLDSTTGCQPRRPDHDNKQYR
jgi:hypothetical protein